MARTEYYDDPDAPEPNSLVVATSAVIVDDTGRILLQRRADSGNWALPGGAMDMTESLTDSVMRETKEETGLDIEVTGIVGTYTDPKHIIAYTAKVLRGELRASHESTALEFVDPRQLDALPIHQTQRLRLGHFLERRTTPFLG